MAYGLTASEYGDLRKRFTYHRPWGDQPERYDRLRTAARDLAEFISENCPPSRECDIAVMKLEEAVMWANAAIARNEVPER